MHQLQMLSATVFPLPYTNYSSLHALSNTSTAISLFSILCYPSNISLINLSILPPFCYMCTPQHNMTNVFLLFTTTVPTYSLFHSQTMPPTNLNFQLYIAVIPLLNFTRILLCFLPLTIIQSSSHSSIRFPIIHNLGCSCASFLHTSLTSLHATCFSTCLISSINKPSSPPHALHPT